MSVTKTKITASLGELYNELEGLRIRRVGKVHALWKADQQLSVARFELTAVDRAIRSVERQIKKLKN